MKFIYKNFKIKSLFIFTFLCCISFSYGQKEPKNFIKTDLMIFSKRRFSFFYERKIKENISIHLGGQRKFINDYSYDPPRYYEIEGNVLTLELRFYKQKNNSNQVHKQSFVAPYLVIKIYP